MSRKKKCRFPVMDWLDDAKKKRQSLFGWLWEFTKKVVMMMTILYAVAFGFTLYICYISLGQGKDISVLNTLVQETNETFRVVVGGYLVKAGIENACKIIKKSNKLEDKDYEEN